MKFTKRKICSCHFLVVTSIRVCLAFRILCNTNKALVVQNLLYFDTSPSTEQCGTYHIVFPTSSHIWNLKVETEKRLEISKRSRRKALEYISFTNSKCFKSNLDSETRPLLSLKSKFDLATVVIKSLKDFSSLLE